MSDLIVFDYSQWKKKPVQIQARVLFAGMPLQLFIQDWMTIKSTEDATYGMQVPFVLWPEQRRLVKWIEEQKIGFFAKPRQRGGSEIFACLILLILLSESNSECLIFSRGEVDAQDFLEKRLASKISGLRSPTDNLGNDLVIWPKFDIGKFKIRTSYGTIAEAFPSHPDAGSGRTARLVVLDEAEKIEDAAAIWTAVKPAVSQNKRGQLFALSTGQKHGTWFKQYIKKIYDGKVQGIGLHFMPWWADPKRDQKWYDEELSQFDSEVDMRCTYPSTIEDIFLSKEGKVFPQFDPREGGRHVYDFEKRMPMHELWKMDLYLAYDPGYDPHPAAFLMCLYNRYTDILYVYDELVLVGVPIHDMGKKIRNMVEKLPVRPKRCVVDTYGNRRGGAGGSLTETKVLNDVTGLLFVSAKKADADGSRQLVSRRLSENKLVILPRCERTRNQMEGWVWGSNGKPVDEEDDTIDDLRYICSELPNRAQKPTEPERPVDPYSVEASARKRAVRAHFDREIGKSKGAGEGYGWLAG